MLKKLVSNKKQNKFLFKSVYFHKINKRQNIDKMLKIIRYQLNHTLKNFVWHTAKGNILIKVEQYLHTQSQLKQKLHIFSSNRNRKHIQMKTQLETMRTYVMGPLPSLIK